VLLLAVELADVSALSPEDGVVELVDEVEEGGFTLTDVDEDELGGVVSVLLLATGGGVVVLGTTTVVSFVFDAEGDGVVVEVVVVRSHAASETPRVSAATRGISFMCSPYGSCEATC
jgi:hypothetical protein